MNLKFKLVFKKHDWDMMFHKIALLGITAAITLFSQPIKAQPHYTPVVNPITKPGWTLVDALSDEFNYTNVSQIDQSTPTSKWNMHLAPGSNNLYFRNAADGGTNYKLTPNDPEAQSNILSIVLKQETYFGTVPDWSYNDQTTSPKKTFYYTSGFMNSNQQLDNVLPGSSNNYGYYFEIRCKLAKGKAFWPAFWLFGNKQGYKEIDIFENFGDNYRVTQFGTNYHAPLECSDGYDVPSYDVDFSEAYHTFGFQWASNRFIWYLDNKMVRSVDASNLKCDHIQWGSMNIQIDFDLAPFLPLDASTVFPAEMKIDYVRTYTRAQKSYCSFTLNGSQAASGIQVNTNDAVIIDATNSYANDNTYFLSVDHTDASGNVLNTLIQRWLTATEVAKLNAFDIRSVCTLSPGNYYKVNLVPGGDTWAPVSKRFFLQAACTVDAELYINGYHNSSSTYPIPIANNQRIIADVSHSLTCDNTYKISVQPLNSSFQPDGSATSKTMTTAQIGDLNYMDVRKFCSDNGLTLQFNKNYWLELSLANSSTPDIVREYFSTLPCTIVSSVAINQQTAFNITIPPGSPIILNGMNSFSCDKTYDLLVQQTDASGNATNYPTQHIEVWLGASDNINDIDLRGFCRTHGLPLQSGAYYRVRWVAGGGSWIEDNHIIYLSPCTTPYSDIQINESNRPFTIASLPIWLDASGSISCDDQYTLTVQEVDDNRNPVGSPVGWNAYPSGSFPNEKNIFIKLDDITHQLTPNKLYAVTWTSTGSPSKNDTKYVFVTGTSGSFHVVGSTTNETDKYNLQGGCSGTSKDVGYIFSLANNSTVTISTCFPETNFDTRIQVFLQDGKTPIAGSYNDNSCGLQSKVTVHLTAGNYMVVVEGCNTTGNFKLDVSAAAGRPASTDTLTSPDANPKDMGTTGSGQIGCSVRPNPNTGSFTLLHETKQFKEIYISNVLGESITEKRGLNTNTYGFDLSDKNKGIYFMRVMYQNGETEVKKVIIE